MSGIKEIGMQVCELFFTFPKSLKKADLKKLKLAEIVYSLFRSELIEKIGYNFYRLEYLFKIM